MLDWALVLAVITDDFHKVTNLVFPHVPGRDELRLAVHHVGVDVAKGLAGAPDDSALFTHDLDVEDIFLDVSNKAGLKGQHCAIVKANHTDGEVLNRVGFPVPVWPDGLDIRWLVSVPREGVARTGHRGWVADEGVGGIEDVHTDVDQWTATLQLFAAEDAPVRDPTAAKGLRTDVQNSAKRTRFDEVTYIL